MWFEHTVWESCFLFADEGVVDWVREDKLVHFVDGEL